MNVEMTLIGFTKDQPHARMGLHVRAHDLEADFRKHAILVSSSLCSEPRCMNQIEPNRAHGWTCVDHDWPLPMKRVPK